MLGCGKDDDDNAPKDCEKNNYGVLNVSFGSATVRHSVLITYPANKFREKTVAIGTTRDTVRVRPGTNYPVSISSINSAGQTLATSNITVSITKCGEQSASVVF